MPTPDTSFRTLVVSLGLSPQVVTETLWALGIAARPGWIPDEIILLTTGEGARAARASLLDDGAAQIRALATAYGRDDLQGLAGRVRIELLGDGGGTADVDTDAAHAAAADRTMHLIRHLTADPRRQIHASIAGGRKSQGALLALSMSLFARPGDMLSHVMVDDAFASRDDFFFPPADRNGAGGSHVRLARIPFPRIRALVPPETLDARHFADAVLGLQRRLDPPDLVVAPVRREASLAGTALDLPPSLFAWLAALARDRSDGGGGLPRTGLPGAVISRWRPAGPPLPRVIDSEMVQEWTSRLNKLVRLDVPALAGRKLVQTTGARPRTRYRLMIEPENITWQDA